MALHTETRTLDIVDFSTDVQVVVEVTSTPQLFDVTVADELDDELGDYITGAHYQIVAETPEDAARYAWDGYLDNCDWMI